MRKTECATKSRCDILSRFFVESTVKHAISIHRTCEEPRPGVSSSSQGNFLKRNDDGQNWGMRLIIECDLYPGKEDIFYGLGDTQITGL